MDGFGICFTRGRGPTLCLLYYSCVTHPHTQTPIETHLSRWLCSEFPLCLNLEQAKAQISAILFSGVRSARDSSTRFLFHQIRGQRSDLKPCYFASLSASWRFSDSFSTTTMTNLWRFLCFPVTFSRPLYIKRARLFSLVSLFRKLQFLLVCLFSSGSECVCVCVVTFLWRCFSFLYENLTHTHRAVSVNLLSRFKASCTDEVR